MCTRSLPRFGLVLTMLGVACVLTACSDAKPPEVASAASSTAPTPPTAPAVPQKEGFFVASGPLIVEHQVDVAAQRDGIVTEVKADSGTPVKAGQVLALLDDRQIAADLDAARARTRSTAADLKNWEAEAKVLQADFERAQKMWDAQLITKEQYDHARFKAESDQWDVKRVQELLVNAQETEHSLELELEKTRIRAPFSGIVARRYIRGGQEVAKGDRMFWVTETSPLRVRFTLPERFVGRLRRGVLLQLNSTDTGDTNYHARVMEISPVVDPSSGTIEVMAEIIDRNTNLRPGMSTTIRVPDQP